MFIVGVGRELMRARVEDVEERSGLEQEVAVALPLATSKVTVLLSKLLDLPTHKG